MSSMVNGLIPQKLYASLKVRSYPFPPEDRSLDDEEEGFIEILDMNDDRRVITVIEVLRPANKTPGTTGNDAYRTSQMDALYRNVNLLEIDLLREGNPTILGSRPPSDTPSPWHYSASLRRTNQTENYQVWHMNLREPLITLPVPLDSQHPDVPLDLQTLLNLTYDRMYYDRSINYSEEIVPPLRPADALWADTLLREAGLRP